MKNHFLSGLWVLPALFLIPYLTTAAVNGAQTALADRAPDAEMCLPAVVSRQIDKNNKLEAVKAQAVIARTNFYRQVETGESYFEILGEMQERFEESGGFFRIPEGIYEKAVNQTKGEVLLYKGELKLVPYHVLSSGKTRDGEEVFHDRAYAYLKSVDSSTDRESPDYLGSSYISVQQMPKKLAVKDRDEAGYVTSLTADGNLLEGEAFCQGMGLASANFTVQKTGGRYRFLCKGKGHGLGLSQYGANEMAKEGSTCEEILEAYFPKMELQDISRKK